MRIDIEKVGEIGVVTLQAEHLDASAADEFKRTMQPILDANHRLVLDMSPLQFVDSAGLGEIVGTFATVRRHGGTLKLLGLTSRIRDLLSITKLLTVFETFDAEGEAVSSFTSVNA